MVSIHVCVYSHIYTQLNHSSRTLMFATKYAYISLYIFQKFLWAPSRPHSYAYISIFQCIHVPIIMCLPLLIFICLSYVLLHIPKKSFSISICTYVTVLIQVHIVLIICLFWSYICMFISPSQTYV